jgi:hypothetical protein
MLIEAYLFEFATHTQLHGHYIYAPGPLRTGVEGEIVAGHLENLVLLTSGDRLLWQAIRRPSARFHLHKDQIMLVFSDEIYLSIPTTEVALQNTVAPTNQRFCSQTLPCAPKPLTCPFDGFGCICIVIYQIASS